MELLDAAAVRAALAPPALADALEAALRGGLDPEAAPVRSRLATPAGELLLMPAADAAHVGAKLVTVRGGPGPAGEPAVQGAYVLFDGASLAPVAVLDGAALTAVRTPAVSALAVRHLAAPGARRAVVWGAGVQAAGHAEALVACCGLERVDVVARRATAAEEVVRRVRAAGADGRALAPGEVAAALAEADVVVCATSAGAPLFDGALVADRTVVVAVGAYTATTREVDSALAARATCVVESRASALAEAGAVCVPIAEGVLRAQDLVTLADVVRGAARPAAARPRLFAGTGMAWQDLVVAAAVVAAARG